MTRLETTLVVLSVLSLLGCANVTTLDRDTPLPSKNGENAGIAIHLDAKQRLVYAKEFGALCAEPSPDALSSIATSIAGGVADPTKGSAELNASLAEVASNIGLRTQSIQLMRDALYRVCEAYYGRAINSIQLAELHKRYQDVLIGVLAIEQLTGAVTPRQVVQSGSAHSDISTQMLNVKALLDQAIKDEEEAKASLVIVEEEAETTDSEIKATNEALADETVDTPKHSELQNKLAGLQTQKDLVTIRVDAAKKVAEKAEQTRVEIEKNHGAISQKSSTTAAGKGTFSEIKQAKVLDATSTSEVAKAVVKIVETIVEKERISDKCLKYLTSVTVVDNKNQQIVNTCIQAVKGKVNTDKAVTAGKVDIRL